MTTTKKYAIGLLMETNVQGTTGQILIKLSLTSPTIMDLMKENSSNERIDVFLKQSIHLSNIFESVRTTIVIIELDNEELSIIKTLHFGDLYPDYTLN